MSELIRPSTILPAHRRNITIRTQDGLNLIGEVATPLGQRQATILTLHPNPSGGGMMDSHIFKKAANRLPAMAGIEIIRFNTRGTESAAGKSEGTFDNGESEKFDVLAAIDFAFNDVGATNLWIMGWSFGTDLALRYAKDDRILGIILLSPPLQRAQESDLEFWERDLRPVYAFIPEHDEYLNPEQAIERFAAFPSLNLKPVDGAKHLWVGEPYVYRILSEVTSILAPHALPLPKEF